MLLSCNQEARQAAEKAYDVARIDEKVNRAVAAANDAVNAARVAVFKAPYKSKCITATAKIASLLPLYDIYLYASHIVIQLTRV